MASEYKKVGRIRPVFKGEWSAAESYIILDVVRRGDGRAAYIAMQDVPAGTPLTDGAYWQPLIDMGQA